MSEKRKRKPSRIGKRPLSDRQMAVIDNYFGRAHFNKALALRLAGYKTGYMKHGSGSDVQLFFKNPRIAEEIDKRRQRLRKKVELTEDWAVEKLMLLASADVVAVLQKLRESDNDLDALDPFERYIVAELVQEERTEGRGDDKEAITVTRIKAEPRIKALDLLMRKLGAYQDKMEISGDQAILEALRAGRNRMQGEDD